MLGVAVQNLVQFVLPTVTECHDCYYTLLAEIIYMSPSFCYIYRSYITSDRFPDELFCHFGRMNYIYYTFCRSIYNLHTRLYS
jgi:hypothetical protein